MAGSQRVGPDPQWSLKSFQRVHGWFQNCGPGSDPWTLGRHVWIRLVFPDTMLGLMDPSGPPPQSCGHRWTLELGCHCRCCGAEPAVPPFQRYLL